MPCAAIGILLAVEDVGERAVGGLALREGRIAVQRRADERMAKLDTAVEGAHQTRRLGCVERVLLDAQRRRRA